MAIRVSMGLMPCSEDEPSDKQIMDLMVPFADFTPVATTWAEVAPGAPRRLPPNFIDSDSDDSDVHLS